MEKRTKWIVVAACLLLAGAANGIMDALQFHGAWQHFDNEQFWNPAVSWMNKWYRDSEGVLHVGKDRFFLSSTVLVGLTDGWHLVKMLYLMFLKTSVVAAIYWRIFRIPELNFLMWLTIWLVLGVIMSGGFHITYSLIF